MSSGLTPVVALFLELMLKNLIRKLFTVMVIGLFLIIIMVVMIMMSVMFVFIGPNPKLRNRFFVMMNITDIIFRVWL